MGYSYANASMTATASGDQAVKEAERAALAAALKADVFTSVAKVPVMKWKATSSTGLVAGLLLDGGRSASPRVSGASGAAGEMGHIPHVVDGPLCACGRRRLRRTRRRGQRARHSPS